MPTIARTFLAEFNQENANTRRTLERIPADFSWKPHDRSPTLGWLAGHIAQLPSWVGPTLEEDGIDMGGEESPPEPETVDEVLERFDANVAAARAALERAPDERFHETWTLSQDGETVFTMPKAVVLRSFVFNHMVHHRAQLTVYLRLNDVPVPALYGPSADEAPPGM